MIVSEEDIKYTRVERLRNSFGVIPILLSLPFILIIVLVLIILSPILLILGFTYDKIVYGLIYKLIGKEKKEKERVNGHKYELNSMLIEFHFLYEFDDELKSAEEKLKPGHDNDDLEFVGYIETAPDIEELNHRYFSPTLYEFKGKLFVQEIILPDFKTNLAVIDCQNKSYEILKEFESGFSASFIQNESDLEIIVRLPNKKKKLIIR